LQASVQSAEDTNQGGNYLLDYIRIHLGPGPGNDLPLTKLTTPEHELFNKLDQQLVGLSDGLDGDLGLRR